MGMVSKMKKTKKSLTALQKAERETWDALKTSAYPVLRTFSGGFIRWSSKGPLFDFAKSRDETK